MVTDHTSKDEAQGGAGEAQSGLLVQLRAMTGALLRSPVRYRLTLLAVALVLVIAATAYGQIRLNRWNQPFYDALAHRQFGQFLVQLGVFGVIAGSLLILNVAQQWLNQMLNVKLRDGLVHDLLQNWLQPRRAFRLAHAGPIGVNPDQRLHEDARHLAELTASLSIGLLQASILLSVFVAVLWRFSSNFALPIGSLRFAIPGYMVWAALIYAGSASLLSLWVGHDLVDRNATRYAREADLRFSLVRVSDHIDVITLGDGEADEQRHIEHDFDAVLAAMRRLVTGLTNLTWVTAGYGWFTLIAPILAAAPLYFGGELSFGGLMMAAGAFNQVQSSMRWFVDNFSSIADWRATLLRVANFRSAVLSTDTLHSSESRIEFVEGEPGRLLIERLEIASDQGCTLLEEKRVEIHAGERVLIVGKPGTGKALLFRTLAGLWPWGAGRITLPKGETIRYLPREPYLPPATLRDILAYPQKAERFEEEAYKRALSRSDLERFVPELDVSDRWDRRLASEEQSRLAIARILVHAPPWLIIDEVFDSLDPDTLERFIDVLVKDLKRTAVIHIGSVFTHHPAFPRVLHLTIDPAARRLTRDAAVAA